MRILCVFLTLLALLLPTGQAARAQDPAECDALAGELGEAPEPEALEAAEAACSEAVRAQPGSLQLLYLYARTLELSGDLDRATRLYQWAAGDGYGPAIQTLARLTSAPTGAEPVEAAEIAEPAGETTPDAPEVAAAEAVDPALVQAADQLDQIAALLEKARGLLPRTSFDPAAVVAEVGAAPEALAEWVATQTALVPYRGRLRGPVGVLMDRYGNSLDRSLLLAALLAEAGHEAVLVHGTLSEADATRLLAVRPAPPPVTGDGLTPAAALTQLGIDPADDPFGLAGAMAEGARQAEAMREAVAAQTRAQGDALLALVSAIATPAADRAGEVEALRDHWWVRVRTGDGWQDLDTGGAQGVAPDPETMEPTALPPELSHRVTLTVIAEFLEADGALRSETLLSHTLMPAGLAGTSVLLWHEPISLPAADELLALGNIDAVERAIVDERSWQPVLLVGSEVYADRIVTVDGLTLPGDEDGIAAARSPLHDMEGTISGQFSGFGTLLDRPPSTASDAPPASDLIAMWLAFDITAPGMPPITHRRAVFDLVGAAARADGGPVDLAVDDDARRLRAEALLEYIDVGIWGATPSPSFIADVAARDLSPFFAEIAGLLRRGTADVAALPGLGEIPRAQLMLQGFAGARAGLAGAAGVILDHPNVMLLRQGHRLAEGDTATTYAMIDIVENGVAQVAAPAGGAFAARLRQGVADTALESALLGSPERSHNTSVLFASDLAAGRDWIALARPEDIGLVDLPADVAAQIAVALGDGYMAVAPPDATGPAAWWRIDVERGTTLGMGATGAGAALTEYLVLLTKVAGQAVCFLGMGSAASNVSTAAGAAAAGAGFALCLTGLQLSITMSWWRILYGSTSAGVDAIGGAVAVGGGLTLGIVGL